MERPGTWLGGMSIWGSGDRDYIVETVEKAVPAVLELTTCLLGTADSLPRYVNYRYCVKLLDIAGVVLLFFFGLPPRGVNESGGSLRRWPGKDAGRAEEGAALSTCILVWAIRLVAGFVLQIIGVFASK